MPNGEIHFNPFSAAVGQKISATGVVSTYSLASTGSIFYRGGILDVNGDIQLIPNSATVGQVISRNSGMTFSRGLCMSPWLNKGF